MRECRDCEPSFRGPRRWAPALPPRQTAAINRGVFPQQPEQRLRRHGRPTHLLDPQARRHPTQSDGRRQSADRGGRAAHRRAQAETFYGVHRERPFFGELVEMMTAAPVVVQVLEGEDAIQRYRDVMGATNPEKAAAGTIRKDFALSTGENSAHGSDAQETAAQEIAQWFSGNEIVG